MPTEAAGALFKVEAISAAHARDVVERGQDDRPSCMRSQRGSTAEAKAAVTVRWRKREGFNKPGEMDLAS